MYLHVNNTILAISVIVIISVIHSFSLNVSSKFQSYASWFKVLLILSLILIGLYYTQSDSALNFSNSWTMEILTPSFAIAFVYVSYSYTGWNAASYIIEEIDKPRINLPKALVRGTLLVTVLYVLMQLVFLKHGTLAELQGQLDIGHVYASNIFGSQGAKTINILISFFLISSISAMIWVGPRVSLAMSKDFKLWQFLQRKNKNNLPVAAVWLQALLSIVYVLTGTFESVLLYCGFILQLSAALTVAGVFVLRKKRTCNHHTLKPLFILCCLWFLSCLVFGYLFI